MQKLEVFLSKSSRPMMLFLSLDIVSDGVDLRIAYREDAIAVLPREAMKLKGLVNPRGGLTFHIQHHFGKLMSWFEADEQVNVIADSTNLRRDSIGGTDQPTHVGVQPVTPCGCNPRFAIFCPEYEMIVKRVVGGGHRQIVRHPCRGASFCCG